jgi:hypothetical protein
MTTPWLADIRYIYIIRDKGADDFVECVTKTDHNSKAKPPAMPGRVEKAML